MKISWCRLGQLMPVLGQNLFELCSYLMSEHKIPIQVFFIRLYIILHVITYDFYLILEIIVLFFKKYHMCSLPLTLDMTQYNWIASRVHMNVDTLWCEADFKADGKKRGNIGKCYMQKKKIGMSLGLDSRRSFISLR